MRKLKVIISAGGRGTRISSLTYAVIPKSLCRVVDAPLLSYQLINIVQCNLKDILISVEEDWQVAEIKQSIRIGEFPKANYLITKHPYGHPLNTFQSSTVKKFIGKNDFLWTYGDLFYDQKLIKKILKNYRENPEVSHGFKLKAKNDLLPLNNKYISYKIGANGIIKKYWESKKPNLTIDAPFIFKNKIIDLIKKELGMKKPRGTRLINRIIDKDKIMVHNPMSLINMNNIKEVKIIKKRIKVQTRKI